MSVSDCTPATERLPVHLPGEARMRLAGVPDKEESIAAGGRAIGRMVVGGAQLPAIMRLTILHEDR